MIIANVMIQILDGLIFLFFNFFSSSFGYFLKNNICYIDMDHDKTQLEQKEYCYNGDFVSIVSPYI